ncbi:tautomerase family protein [Mycobacterium sp.]|jgi:phenylpyruvate tautomerase PptA (4-oxalocrotonate tautomerase family)|uniref:tautomerase family protein n=1 Tax=Mycobacterium sp. TaxID=1785 RepID=UPI002D4B1072|nr:tautomerase family protein [Mycobacterium sp.]HZA08931.1 tautomerase family protein [Mycobacterium sp.]
MPLVRIDLSQSIAPQRRLLIGDIVYQTMVDVLNVPARLNAEANVRPEDVFIVLTEVAKENWSFGNGEAQYASDSRR